MSENAKKWKQVPWLRIGAEAVAIIASILIAFALDAWWDRRELAEREAWYLESLEKDCMENRESLEHVIQVQNDVMESIQKLVLFGATGTPTLDADSVVSLVTRIFGDINIGFSPNLGTYQELLNTSSLQVIRSDSLRALLADFGVRVGRVSGMQDMASDGWNRDITEHLMTRMDLAVALPQYLLGVDSIVDIRPSGVDYRSLPSDPVFRNIMVGRLAVTAVRLSMYRALEESVDEILTILGQELGHEQYRTS
ncbi:MAG: hypothetical protein PVJ76_16875 [Gemmatimonadota bacterium]